MKKKETSVKAKLEAIQKTLARLGVESGPANLARIFGVAQSSIFRWLNDEVQPRGKQAKRIDLLYRTAREVEAGTEGAERILKNLVKPRPMMGLGVGAVATGASLLSLGLVGAVAAAGLGWLLADEEDADIQGTDDSREEDGSVSQITDKSSTRRYVQ
ncbi:MAG: hypothetical protein J4F42_03285 [Desulfurellaceae bacterium]|nr:hypothetical protein [Desulfurellaceae bacterium]